MQSSMFMTTAVFCFAAMTASAFGQAPEAIPVSSGLELKYFDFFVVKGGWIAYLIILLSVVALALTIEHTLTIRRATIVPPHAVQRIRELTAARNFVDVVRFTAEEPSLFGYVLAAGLREAGRGLEHMERAMEEALDERAAKLYRKIEYLNIIGAVSPMMGLFGTVVGMILLFSAIHASNTFPSAQVVADRVAIALVATFWGLAVAIPALSVYAVFRNRIDVLTSECAAAVDRILSEIKACDDRSSPAPHGTAAPAGAPLSAGLGSEPRRAP